MAETRKRTPRLGRGLSSLMAQPVKVPATARDQQPDETDADSSADAEVRAGNGRPTRADAQAADGTPAGAEASELQYLNLVDITANPHQPRRRFDEASLAQLAESIRSEGLVQPIVVRPIRGEGAPEESAPRYELVAGERRLRAAENAGLSQIPAIVRELTDQQSAEWALIENLQREDLNPIERAEALGRLRDQFGLSHEQIAERVALDRSTVSNLLRLLELEDQVCEWVRDGRLSMGQARALAGLAEGEPQRRLAELAIRQAWSVRRLEQAVRQAGSGDAPAKGTGSSGRAKAAHLADLERRLSRELGTKVQIRSARRKGAGTLSIDFYSLDQFDQLLSRLGVEVD